MIADIQAQATALHHRLQETFKRVWGREYQLNFSIEPTWDNVDMEIKMYIFFADKVNPKLLAGSVWSQPKEVELIQWIVAQHSALDMNQII